MGTDDARTLPPVAINVSAVRRRRGLTVRGLAERMDEVGLKLLPSGVTKIEQGQRGVSAEELLALAVALNVSPARLLLPDAYDREQQVALTPAVSVRSDVAWRWAEGRSVLGRAAETEIGLLTEVDEYQQERPLRLRVIEQHPLQRAASGLALSSEYAVLASKEARAGEMAEALASARRELERVSAELERLELERLELERLELEADRG